MLVYRVFPHDPAARRADQPGHPLYVHPDQGLGRLDNPGRYRARYLALDPAAAVAEAFGNLTIWQPSMLRFPQLPGATRALGVYRLDEEGQPLLDLDNARNLLDRGLRPTQVISGDRPATQAWARRIYEEGRWAGVRWWSFHRPHWTVIGLWAEDALEVVDIHVISGHPALVDAARSLGKILRGW